MYCEVLEERAQAAVDWFCAQPEIAPGGIGMTGVCLGGQITLLMAIREPRIKASVLINSSIVID